MSCNCPTCNQPATSKEISTEDISQSIRYVSEIIYCPYCYKEFMINVSKENIHQKKNEYALRIV